MFIYYFFIFILTNIDMWNIITYIDKYKYIDMRCSMFKDYKESSKIFKAFCDESRLKILEILLTGEKCSCEMCGNDILEKLKISQSTLSHHMKILTDSKIVIARKEGKWTYYNINKQNVDYAISLLNQLKNN